MNKSKLIKTKKDHKQALERLVMLIGMEPEFGSSEFAELDALAALIEIYEKEHFPMDKPDPIEAIKFRIEQQGLTV
ncbi:MAG: hypothetical protein KJ556_19925 [Gammaproteobacteria bacterium]|nr:hypothetical protein [Gammaproteobacteria bacterium]MBU2058665.1 hypothetical protein [Gammaproteobacteria bacterium]MBU2177369.1 hypothetical protein [Gammaproteobacteria bacterium]MBU2246077.1 hypothetical protein [Gammaproteobacteria bacterium]MBU2345373.1 hypothetical protein [Gammaproteobacteria bacterium]